MNIKQYIKHTLLASALLASSIFGYQKPTYADISEDMPNSDSQKTLSQKELHVLSVFAERITQLVTTQRINQSSYNHKTIITASLFLNGEGFNILGRTWTYAIDILMAQGRNHQDQIHRANFRMFATNLCREFNNTIPKLHEIHTNNVDQIIRQVSVLKETGLSILAMTDQFLSQGINQILTKAQKTGSHLVLTASEDGTDGVYRMTKTSPASYAFNRSEIEKLKNFRRAIQLVNDRLYLIMLPPKQEITTSREVIKSYYGIMTEMLLLEKLGLNMIYEANNFLNLIATPVVKTSNFEHSGLIQKTDNILSDIIFFKEAGLKISRVAYEFLKLGYQGTKIAEEIGWTIHANQSDDTHAQNNLEILRKHTPGTRNLMIETKRTREQLSIITKFINTRSYTSDAFNSIRDITDIEETVLHFTDIARQSMDLELKRLNTLTHPDTTNIDLY